MKIFIFERIAQVTDNWHPEGGLVIIAKDIEHAKEIISGDECISITDEEWDGAESFELAEDVEPKFWVMPDAGCC
jgi:hypothetical protein